jgi:folate-binding protein YgfZ
MSTDLKSELDAILHRAAIAPLSDRAFLRVTGSDATRWLNGMVTNSIQTLAPGEGCYNFLLNAQGRILGDCTIYREIDPAEPPSFLLEAHSSQLEAVRQHLDHFIIMDDVELTPAFTDQTSLLIVGPEASSLLTHVGLPTPDPLRLAHADSPHGPVLLLTPSSTLIPTFELRADSAIVTSLATDLRTADATEVSPEALEALRLLEARPLYGRDITERYLPQETNQPQALHFNKGCYLGQEIVERIRSRGQVHRLLTPLTLTGSLPTEFPTPIEAAALSPGEPAKPAGEITSATIVPLPDGDQILALGYVRREALDTHAALTCSGGSATPRAASKELLTTNH